MLKKHTTIGLLAIAAILLTSTLSGFGAGQPVTTDLKSALDRAIDDERHALAFYTRIMAKHGERRPFSNIVFAERRHEAALLAQYERLGLTPPPDTWATRDLEVPGTFREACDAAEFAEIANVRLYDDLIASVNDGRVRTVFEQLQTASAARHLPAFRRHGSGWRVVREDPTPTQQAQVARARSARDDLFGALFARLQGAMRSGGPASAINVCKEAAPALATKTAAEHGVRIGRTSWKLRNPENTGPGWMTLVAADRPTTPQILTDRSGRLGYVAPIKIIGACLTCHGPADGIAPEIRARLDALYPADQATGFNAGDLRGWFWVEVPRTTASPPHAR